MPVTVRNTDILFDNGTTQSTAAVSPSTDFGGLGSYAVLMMAANTNLAVGATIAGSSLRYNPNYGGVSAEYATTVAQYLLNNPFVKATPSAAGVRTRGSNTYDGGGTALSGTWRKVSPGPTYIYAATGYGTYIGWADALYVRIS